jgi:hypothetical protein
MNTTKTWTAVEYEGRKMVRETEWIGLTKAEAVKAAGELAAVTRNNVKLYDAKRGVQVWES